VAAVIVEDQFQPYESTRQLADAEFLVPAYRPVVDMSLVPPGSDSLREDTIWVPAILDPGFSGEVLIAEERFRILPWYREFIPTGRTAISFFSGARERAVTWDADLWLCPNRDGVPPVRIELNRGLIRYEFRRGGRALQHRAPLVGAHALAAAGIRLCIDYHTFRFSLELPDPFTAIQFPQTPL
jgi:hypothetical protein